jgi:hypothetical protein
VDGGNRETPGHWVRRHRLPVTIALCALWAAFYAFLAVLNSAPSYLVRGLPGIALIALLLAAE